MDFISLVIWTAAAIGIGLIMGSATGWPIQNFKKWADSRKK